MDSLLSREVLKAHNATDGSSGDTKQEQTTAVTKKTPGIRDRTNTMQSETGSMHSGGTGKLKLFRLRHKIKAFGGSMSKSGSESLVQKQYENTYQTEPKSSERFSSTNAEKIIKSVLEGYLKGKSYDPKKFPNLCKSLAELIKERIKTTGCTRYKLIAHVMILENQGQSMRHVSRSLWNKDSDNYATATFETKDFCAVGSVFAAYYD